MHRSPVRLEQIVARTVEDHRSLFEARSLTLQLDASSTQQWVLADAARISQAIGNLLSNAGKFTPSGGRIIVSVGSDTATNEAVVVVSDNGIGIAEEHLDRAFEPFQQLGRTAPDRAQAGLGLGLALVQGLVSLHEGTVTLHSTGPGQGAKAVIRLPRIAAVTDFDERPAVEVLPSTQGAPLRVLIIEDNPDAAEMLRQVIELGGDEVQTALSGQAGLDAARAIRPDCVLCDLGLPNVDGYAVARTLRAEPALPGILLVALTGYALPEDQRKAIEAGFDLHLPKPVDPAAIEAVLRRRRAAVSARARAGLQ